LDQRCWSLHRLHGPRTGGVGPNSVRPGRAPLGPTTLNFPSCATESNNAAIAAALKANPTKRHIVTSQVEHSSVLNYCMVLERDGFSGSRSGGFTGSRSGGFTPRFPGGDSTSPHGGVNPPLREPGYRVTYLPVDREGLVRLCWFN